MQEKQKEAVERLQISRDDIIQGLLRAAQEDGAAGNPLVMIAACREIGKMLGYFNQPVTPAPQDLNEDLARAMSDADLAVLASESN